jgi:hypothetical protein
MDGKPACKKAHKLARNLLAASCSHSGLGLSGSLNTQHSIRKNEIESSSTQKRKQINRRNLKLGFQKVQGDKHCSYYQLGAVKSVAGAKMETYRMEARVCDGVRERERERKAETCELGSVKKETGELWGWKGSRCEKEGNPRRQQQLPALCNAKCCCCCSSSHNCSPLSPFSLPLPLQLPPTPSGHTSHEITDIHGSRHPICAPIHKIKEKQLFRFQWKQPVLSICTSEL